MKTFAESCKQPAFRQNCFTFQFVQWICGKFFCTPRWPFSLRSTTNRCHDDRVMWQGCWTKSLLMLILPCVDVNQTNRWNAKVWLLRHYAKPLAMSCGQIFSNSAMRFSTFETAAVGNLFTITNHMISEYHARDKKNYKFISWWKIQQGTHTVSYLKENEERKLWDRARQCSLDLS